MSERPDFEADPDLTAGVGFFNTPAPEPGGEWEDPTAPRPEDADSFKPEIAEAVSGLMWLGYLTDSFSLWGHEFTIKTLRSGEELCVTQLINQFKETLGLDRAFTIAYVAASLVTVDGETFVSQLGEGHIHRLAQIRQAFDKISNTETGWYYPLVEAIYQRYSVLSFKQASAFAAVELKSAASRQAF